MTATTPTTTGPHVGSVHDRLGPHTDPEWAHAHDCFAPRSLRARVWDRVRPVHEVSGEGSTTYEVVVCRPVRGRVAAGWAWLRERTWTARLYLLAGDDCADPLMPARQHLATVYAGTRLGVIQAARHLAVDLEHRSPLACGGIVSNTCPLTITVVDGAGIEN